MWTVNIKDQKSTLTTRESKNYLLDKSPETMAVTAERVCTYLYVLLEMEV